MTAKWSDYVLCLDEEVEAAWASAANQRQTLYVLGEGFDPRALVALRRLLASGAAADVHVLSIRLGEPRPDSKTGELARRNIADLDELGRAAIQSLERLPFPQVEERRSAGRRIIHDVLNHDSFKAARHVIVDVSALPGGIYFPLISGILQAAEQQLWAGELQVVVVENPEIDRAIVGEGVSTPNPIAGFKFALDLEGEPGGPLVWAPVLGERAGAQLEAIRVRLHADEVCPVLPFPARNARRADDLLLEHRELLVDRLQVEPANYIYANESNPFDLYRALGQLHARYRRALQPLGRAMVVVSTHASKMLSLGALLAAHEHEMPVINAEADHYLLQPDVPFDESVERSRPACLWLWGEPTR